MKSIKLIGLMTLMALTLIGCSESKNNNKEVINESEGKQKVRIILDYVPNTNHAGIYVARELGYYNNEGLEVEIIEPTDGVTETLIATGNGEFGISFQENVTVALAQDVPLPIKAIATIIEHNTSGFGSIARKNIKSIKDFEGKVYGGWGSTIEEAILKGIMEQEGADFSKLKMVTSGGLNYSILDGDIDIIWIFEAWDKIAAKRSGMDINYIPVRDLDKRLDFYSPVIITSNELINKDPEMIKKFMKATSKGYQYAIGNPTDAAKILHNIDTTKELGMIEESQIFLSSKYSEDKDRWGEMKDDRWDNFTSYLFEKGLINKLVKSSDQYSNEFLPN